MQTNGPVVVGGVLDAVEHGPQLGQPLTVDGGHVLHVLLAGHHQLVVHHVIRSEPHPEQGGGRMKVARHPRSHVHILAYSLIEKQYF